MISRLRMSTKLYIGFGTILVLLTLVGLIGYATIDSASGGFSEYRGLARDTNLAGRLQANMLMVRMNVKDFIITASEKDRQQYAEYFGKMRTFMETAQQEIHSPDRAALVDKADEEVKLYGKTFDHVVELQNRRNELVNDVLNVEGPKTERLLTEIMQSAHRDEDINAAYRAGTAIRNLLLGRLYVMKFLDSNAEADVDRVNAELGALDEELRTLNGELQNRQRRELLAQALELVEVYHEGFLALVGVINERNDLITNTLDRIGPAIATHVEDVKLSVMADQDALGPRLQADNDQGILLISILGCFALLLGAATAFLITRTVLGQLGADPAELMRVARKVAEGDLRQFRDASVSTARGVYQSMLEMTRSLGKKVELAKTIAAKDLCQDVELASEQDELGLALKDMTKNLQALIGEVQEASVQVSVGSGQVSESSQSLSGGATQTAASLEEITSSMTQIASQTTSNAENSVAANRMMETAKTTVHNGRAAGQEMADSMSEISSASEQVARIIKVIDEIAFQTNLLALNAAVEAARAGRHGKGFAVVAEEVRNLAGRSAEAAKQTQQLIENQVTKVELGVSLTERLDESFKEIVESSEQVSDLISKIAKASTEQAEGVSQVNDGLVQIDQVTQQNTANAEETASAAEELSSQAQQLRATVGEFKIALEDNTCGTKLRVKQARPAALPQGRATATTVSKDGWGDGWGDAPPEQVISLDDDAFGKY